MKRAFHTMVDAHDPEKKELVLQWRRECTTPKPGTLVTLSWEEPGEHRCDNKTQLIRAVRRHIAATHRESGASHKQYGTEKSGTARRQSQTRPGGATAMRNKARLNATMPRVAKERVDVGKALW